MHLKNDFKTPIYNFYPNLFVNFNHQFILLKSNILMDIFYLSVSFLLIIIGLVGCFIPIIPGPITGWFGFLFLNQIEQIKLSTLFLVLTFIIAFIVFIIDNIIPVIGAKVFGGSKKGIIGAGLGLIIGIIFLGPFGLIVGPFLGALFGELINGRNNLFHSFKAAFGAILGLISGVFLKLTVSGTFLMIYIYEVWKIKDYFI
tara:strand:+ start:133 stop:735 length:603 start_codon:yes stop_codon:yes gene_type:complete